MSSEYDPMARSDPPSTAVNVASAYPPNAAGSQLMPRLLAGVTLIGAILVLFVHYGDHPAAKSIKRAAGNAMHSASGKSKGLQSNGPASVGHLAVCFSGNVGTLAQVGEQNINAIRAVDPSAAIFYHLDLQDDYYNDKTGKHYKTKHEIGSLQSVFDAAQAVAVKTYSASEVAVPEQAKCSKKDAETRRHFSHKYMRFHAAAGCYDMIKDVENKAGKQFEWILQSQPNMKIMVKLPPSDVQPRVHLSGDAMALMPRSLADEFFTLTEAFSDGNCAPLDDMSAEACTNYSYDNDSTECLIIKWLKRADITPSNGVYLNRRIVYPDDNR